MYCKPACEIFLDNFDACQRRSSISTTELVRAQRSYSLESLSVLVIGGLQLQGNAVHSVSFAFMAATWNDV